MKKKVMVGILVVLFVALAVVAVLLIGKQRKASEYQEQISLGDQYLAELDYENAEICYEKAIEIDKKRASAYVNLSMVYISQNRYEEAREILEEARETVSGQKGLELIQRQQETVEGASGGSAQGEQAGTDQDQQGESKPGDEDQSQDSEEKKPEGEQALFTQGYGWISRDGWGYLRTESGLYIFRDGEAQMTASVSGDISYGLMAVDGGVYFGQDQALKFRMDSTGEVTTIYQGSREMEPMGLTDKYLYFAEYTDEGQDGQVIHQMDRSDGSLQTFKFSDFCAHSDTAFCGERFFYSRGVADVGTSGVKEVDPVSGQTQVIAEDASGQLLAQGDVLYYVRAQEAGDYTQVAAELIRWDTASGESQVLLTGIGREIGGLLGVVGDCVYTSSIEGMMEIKGQEKRTVAPQGCAPISADETGVYYTLDQVVYRYDSRTQSSTELLRLGEREYVVGVGGGYLTYRSGDDYKRVELGS